MDGAELMRKVAAGFAKSDLQPLLDAVHPEIVWKTAAKSPGLFRFNGEYKSDAIRELLAQISMDYTFHRFAPKEIVSSGDIVWGLFDVRFRSIRRRYRRRRKSWNWKWRFAGGSRTARSSSIRLFSTPPRC